MLPDVSRIRLIRRDSVDRAIDWMRFRLDTFPRLDYQPLPWLGLERAARSAGTDSRWTAMAAVLDEVNPASALDIGANVGWFTHKLASRGVPVVGVESNPKYYRTALYALRR